MNDNKIGWRALNFDFDDYEDEDDTEQIFFNDDDDDDDDDDLEGIDLKLPKILVTPMGPFRVDDSLNPFRHYEFWMGDTNFNLSAKVVAILEKIPGVDKLRILSRYSFVIAIGTMFEFSNVRREIEEKLCGGNQKIAVENAVAKNILLDRYEKLSKNNYWALILLPNGSIDEVVSDTLNDDFLMMLSLFKESRDSCNSMIFCSHKELLEDGKAAS
jgi:hypothetical protein